MWFDHLFFDKILKLMNIEEIFGGIKKIWWIDCDAEGALRWQIRAHHEVQPRSSNNLQYFINELLIKGLVSKIKIKWSDFIENFNVALELLRKAESLTEEGDKYRAVTYNNFACIFRRTKKLRSALSYLEKALEIEYNYLHYSDESVDDCL